MANTLGRRFTIPQSKKAVDEHLSEVIKTEKVSNYIVRLIEADMKANEGKPHVKPTINNSVVPEVKENATTDTTINSATINSLESKMDLLIAQVFQISNTLNGNNFTGNNFMPIVPKQPNGEGVNPVETNITPSEPIVSDDTLNDFIGDFLDE